MSRFIRASCTTTDYPWNTSPAWRIPGPSKRWTVEPQALLSRGVVLVVGQVQMCGQVIHLTVSLASRMDVPIEAWADIPGRARRADADPRSRYRPGRAPPVDRR
jgi:hypothetical protein